MEKMTARLLLTSAVIAASAAHGQTPKFLGRDAPAVIAMSGAWDISSSDGARRCRITFNRGGIAGEFLLVGVPPPCRMSMPQLGKRNGWGLAPDGTIHLGPGGEEPVLIFTKSADSSYNAGGLRLEPVGRTAHGVERASTVAIAAAQIAPATAPQNAERAKIAGRYAIARTSAETGCALALQTTPVRIQGGGENIWAASLAGECRDDGLKTFDPAGWRFDNGRIFLVAKKGHSIGFTPDANRTSWAKDPPAGRPLFLKRAAH